MFSVKVEYNDKSPICRGCLSTDRETVQINKLTELFFTLLGAQRELCESQLILCWECVALLNKIQSFQSRIQHAQFLLQQSSYELDDLPATLSNLTTVNQNFYDSTLEHEEIIEKNVTPNEFLSELNNESPNNQPKDEDIKREKSEDDDSIANDEQLGINNEDSLSDNELLIIDYNKLKRLETEKPKVKIKREEEFKKQSIKRYESKATITKLILDETDLNKHFTKTYITESEIEDVLKRDMNAWGVRKLANKCSQCKNSYKRIVDLRRHETFNHLQPTFPTKCKECGTLVASWEALEEHWRKHNVYYKCCLCGWLSHSPASITRHRRRNHTKLYTCNACDNTFRTLRDFSNHYKERHERIICDHCGKSFLKKHTLEVHIKRHHTPATCQECNRTYAHYHVLENHYRMYHPHLISSETSTELAYCVECDKQFPSVYKYRRHLSTAAKHTPPKPVRVPCPECGKVFARKIRMTNHYNSVHMNNTKHRCDICNKTFCSAFSARTHRQHVHEKIPLPKNKMCDICGRGFSTNRILSNHRRTHTGERPYKCIYCPATFAQRTAMKTHEKTQHKRGPC